MYICTGFDSQTMYILIDKGNKKCYPGEDLGAVSFKSGMSINTLWYWVRKMKDSWFENMGFILVKENKIKSRRGGINSGNEKYFNK